MTDILKKLAALGRIHREIAEPFGEGRLECSHCYDVRIITVEDTARYFARGWPVCCGETMTWIPGNVKVVK